MSTIQTLLLTSAFSHPERSCGRAPVTYGPGAPNEDELQLIGPVADKHVLEIGCGGAQAAVAFAKRSAVVTGLDIAEAQLRFARELAARERVEITLLQGDMANLRPGTTAGRDAV